MKAWVRKNLWWIKWIGVAVGLMLGGVVLSRWRARRGTIGQPMTWRPLPGGGSVAVLDPDTGRLEVLSLPENVKTKDLVSVGISTEGGAYVVETKHMPTDRRSSGGGGSLEL